MGVITAAGTPAAITLPVPGGLTAIGEVGSGVTLVRTGTRTGSHSWAGALGGERNPMDGRSTDVATTGGRDVAIQVNRKAREPRSARWWSQRSSKVRC
jgi:hypothetical protein